MTRETFTHGYIFSLLESLKELAKIDVPAKVGIRVARLIRAINKEYEPISETRNKLITKYGEKDEKGRPFINASSPRWDEFATEHDAMMLEKVEMEFEKVVLPDDVRLPVGVLVALEPFLAVADIPSGSANRTVTDITQLVEIGKH